MRLKKIAFLGYFSLATSFVFAASTFENQRKYEASLTYGFKVMEQYWDRSDSAIKDSDDLIRKMNQIGELFFGKVPSTSISTHSILPSVKKIVSSSAPTPISSMSGISSTPTFPVTLSPSLPSLSSGEHVHAELLRERARADAAEKELERLRAQLAVQGASISVVGAEPNLIPPPPGSDFIPPPPAGGPPPPPGGAPTFTVPKPAGMQSVLAGILSGTKLKKVETSPDDKKEEKKEIDPQQANINALGAAIKNRTPLTTEQLEAKISDQRKERDGKTEPLQPVKGKGGFKLIRQPAKVFSTQEINALVINAKSQCKIPENNGKAFYDALSQEDRNKLFKDIKRDVRKPLIVHHLLKFLIGIDDDVRITKENVKSIITSVKEIDKAYQAANDENLARGKRLDMLIHTKDICNTFSKEQRDEALTFGKDEKDLLDGTGIIDAEEEARKKRGGNIRETLFKEIERRKKD